MIVELDDVITLVSIMLPGFLMGFEVSMFLKLMTCGIQILTPWLANVMDCCELRFFVYPSLSYILVF